LHVCPAAYAFDWAGQNVYMADTETTEFFNFEEESENGISSQGTDEYS